MKVYLNDPVAPSVLTRLQANVEIVDNFDHPEELDAIIVRQQYCTADVIQKAVRCKLIQQHGIGLDRIDLEAAKKAGIPVKNTPGTNARSVAEYTLTLMLGLSRKACMIDRKTRAGELKSFGLPETVGIEMTGKKLGLIGSGNIAQHVAQIARDGFQMQVFCYDPFTTEERIRTLQMTPVSELKVLFETCEYVSLHCLLTKDTYHMVNADILASSNPNLIVINTARGGLIDEGALYDALMEKRIAAAGLDILEEQPPSVDDPLLKLDNVMLGMHVAGSTLEAMERTGHAAVDSVFAALGIKESTK